MELDVADERTKITVNSLIKLNLTKNKQISDLY